MSKFFFIGNYFGVSGPNIVNTNYVRCLKDKMLYITYKNKLIRGLEILWKVLLCKVIVFSGVSSFDHLLIPICQIFQKKIVFIMHGYLRYENKINNSTNIRGEKNELLLLKNSNVILCVSETFMRIIELQFPKYSKKLSFLTNGVDWQMLNSIELCNMPKDNKRIVLLGGGRRTKRNVEVCEAVSILNQRYQDNYHVEVYGYYRENDFSRQISEMPFATFHQVIPHEQLLQIFHESFLFVQNSDFEPFSLGVVEALVCGCNILISQNVGAKDIISGLTDKDIITDTADIKQIADKIYVISKEGNNSRLLNSIDKEQTSIQASAERLLSITNQFV